MKSKILLIGVLFLMGAPCVSADQEFFPFLGSINSDNVNIRAGGNTNFERMGQFSKNDDVVVVGEKYNWYKINLPKTSPLYISDQYLTEDGLVTGSKVNVRARASINATAVIKVVQGDHLEVLEHQEGWYKVVPPSKSFAWVSKDFLAFKSKYVPDEEIIILPDVKQEAVKEEAAWGALESIQGVLQPVRANDDPRIQYEVIVDSNEKYFIDGFGHILDDFENLTVLIQGKRKLSNTSSIPVLMVKSIQIVL